MGRITKKKRIDISLHAFSIAKQISNQKLKFVICGTGIGYEVEEIKALVKVLNIESDVEFRGWVDSSEKQRALIESDCFILTSEDENFAIAAAEALSFGIPCILSSNVALASLVLDYSAGEVFAKLEPSQIADSILRIANMDRERARLNSLQAADVITWDQIVKNWNSHIQNLL